MKKSHLQQHVKAVHEGIIRIRDKKFKCDRCSFSSTCQKNLTDHINGVHDNIRPHKCDKCDYAAKKKGNLQVHVKSFHEGIRIIRKKNFKCDRCSFSSVKQK